MLRVLLLACLVSFALSQGPKRRPIFIDEESGLRSFRPQPAPIRLRTGPNVVVSMPPLHSGPPGLRRATKRNQIRTSSAARARTNPVSRSPPSSRSPAAPSSSFGRSPPSPSLPGETRSPPQRSPPSPRSPSPAQSPPSPQQPISARSPPSPPSHLRAPLVPRSPPQYVDAGEKEDNSLGKLHIYTDHGLGVLGDERNQPPRSQMRMTRETNRLLPLALTDRRPDTLTLELKAQQPTIPTTLGPAPAPPEDLQQLLRPLHQDPDPEQDTFCEFGALPAFIRVPQALIMGIPTIVSAVDVVGCAGFCRNNTEPTGGGTRLCQGFNFQDSGQPTCEFFDVEARLGPLNRNVGVRSFYYDKICLKAVLDALKGPVNVHIPGIEQCFGRPYSFEAIPDAQLQGNVRKTLVVADEAECLSACLRETTFTCMSVNFDIRAAAEVLEEEEMEDGEDALARDEHAPAQEVLLQTDNTSLHALVGK